MTRPKEVTNEPPTKTVAIQTDYRWAVVKNPCFLCQIVRMHAVDRYVWSMFVCLFVSVHVCDAFACAVFLQHEKSNEGQNVPVIWIHITCTSLLIYRLCDQKPLRGFPRFQADQISVLLIFQREWDANWSLHTELRNGTRPTSRGLHLGEFSIRWAWYMRNWRFW